MCSLTAPLALALLLPMVLLRPTTATPAPLVHRAEPDLPQPTYSCAEDPTDCNRPPDASVYICENINFQPPCFLLRIGEFNQPGFYWQPDPYIWHSNLIGSWGPAPGISTILYNTDNTNQTTFAYPGTTDVGDFWRSNLWYFEAGWDPNVDPATLPKTVAAPALAPTAGARSMEKGVAGGDGERPWWIQGLGI